MSRLETLRNMGVEVYLCGGVAAGGIQHSKTLLVDGWFLLGSTNWISSTRNNHEISSLLELSD